MIDNSDKMLEALSVVILSYNRHEELLVNLPLLCNASRNMGFELIVVDNASTDGSREFLAELEKSFPSIQVILNEENLGVAGGRNLGWQEATRDYILNIDDDTRLGELEIVKLYQIAISKPNVGVISPRIVHAVTGVAQNDHGTKEYFPANFHGACHLVRVAAYRKVGEIDPSCSFGGEELDYSIRVMEAGYSILYTPQVTVQHNNILRTGEEGIWRRQKWIYNYCRVHFKHFPKGMACMLSLRYGILHLVSGVRQHGCLLVFSLPKQVVKGAIDGVRHYQPVSKNVKMFYSDPTLKPDFGNISLLRKLYRSIERKFIRSAVNGK